MGFFQGLHPGEVHRAGCALQEQAQDVGGQEPGDGGQNQGAQCRDPKGCNQARSGRSAGRSSQGAVYRSFRCRLDGPDGYRRRDGEYGEKEQEQSSPGSSGEFSSQGGEDFLRVRFARHTSTTVFEEENPVHKMNFSVPTFDFAEWDNKPWALHGGAHTDGLAMRLLRYCLNFDDYKFSSGWDLSRTVPQGDGDRHQGGDGGLLLHGGKVPAEMLLELHFLRMRSATRVEMRRKD